MQGHTITSNNVKANFEYANALFEAYSTVLPEYKLLSIVKGILGNSFDSNNATARDVINSFVMNYYPNETTIRSNFIKKVLLEQHNNQTVSVFEFPVGSSRVDICKISAHSSAYEIKTDLDDFKRLNKQLLDYFDVFEFVYVITSENRYKEIQEFLPKECGIYSYRQVDDGTYLFKCRRRAEKSSAFNSRKQLMALPKKDILTTLGITNFSTTKEDVLKIALDRFSAKQANSIFKDYLKARYRGNWAFLKENYSKIYEIDYEWFYRNNLNPESIY